MYLVYTSVFKVVFFVAYADACTAATSLSGSCSSNSLGRPDLGTTETSIDLFAIIGNILIEIYHTH